MTTTRFALSTGNFSQNWSNAGLITANDDWSGVASIVGYRGDELTSGNDFDPRLLTNGSPAPAAVIDVNANQTSPNTFATGGVSEFAIANPTIALTGSGTADAPHIVIYLDATGRENIRFQANLRDLDGSTDNAAQQIAVQWRVGSGNWNNAVYFSDVTTGPSLATAVTAVDVTLGAGANNAADLEIRIITTNAASNDEWVGIDDIVVSSAAQGLDATPPALAAVNPVDPDDGAVAVPADDNIVLRFTETIVAGSGSFTLSNGTDVRTIAITDPQVTISGNTLTINPTTDLAGGTTYALTAGAGIVEDAAGNDFAGIGAGVLDFTIAAPLVPITIGEIQGLGHTSLYAGSTVLTNGVVTAIDTNGFYIQSASGATDGDSRTSDGIFIFTSTAPNSVAIGDLVQVSGTVSEFRPGGDLRNLTITQIISPTYSKLRTAAFDIITIGDGALLPPTSVIDDDSFASYDPTTDGIDFWESLEGMKVTIDTPIAVSNTNSFGETYVVASGGVGATGMSESGGIAISQGDSNPEKLQLDNDNGLFAGFTNIFSVGDRLSNVTGIISYAFQSFELLVTEAVTTTTDVTAVKEVTSLVEAADKLSIGDYNLENLSANDSPAKIASLASDIVNNLKSPDILGVQEIQDANGATAGGSLSGQATADVLIAAIVAAGGPTYAYVEVAPSVANSTGGEPNGNIRNGFFYDPARVTYVAGSAQLIEDAAYTNSRRPLVAQFEFNGEKITLINLHSTSRGGSDPQWGATQPPANAGDSARMAQATAVKVYVDGLLAIDPAAKIVVQGDLNGFAWENAIQALVGGGTLSDLATLLPLGERYSYQFEGNNQQLDHMLTTGNLRAVAQFDTVRLNSQLPEAAQVSTDHDGLLAIFEIPVQLTGTDDAETINGTNASEIIRALGGGDRVFGNGGNDQIFGGEGADTLQGGAGRNIINGGGGNDVIGGEAIAGVHTVDGGTGFDYFIANSAGGTVVVDLNAGSVTGGYADGSTLTSVEMLKAVRGNFAVEFYGDNVVNNLIGTAFADILSGGGGNDRLTGGKGADTLSGGAGADKFMFKAGEINGDVILDFDGAGVGLGDTLNFEGFGPGAVLSNVGNVWTISYGAGLSEVFTMNVTALAPGDAIFG
jgi:predicted extracellular nuclease